jgi:predicted membrane GTPase involved in stress response
MVNGSPFGGKEGEFKTSRQLEERLYKELETDMALRVETNPTGGWTVSGRGELHLAILMERMRREGYEFQVARPQVIDKVIEGKTISGELTQYKEIPSLFTRMVKIGEESGKLAPMLGQVAQLYEEETERTLQLMVSLSQPILLIVMGGAIGAIILSVLLPLADVQSLLQT